MTITNAIKKLTKAGYEVNPIFGNAYKATKAGQPRCIEFYRNGSYDQVATIRIRRQGDKDDCMTDYFAGYFVDTITAAIKSAAA